MDKRGICSKGALVIIGGRPGMGKTCLAIDIARHLSHRQKENVLIVSLDESKERIKLRMLNAENQPTKYDNIIISDSPLRSINEIEELCQKAKNVKTVIIDFIQLLCADKGGFESETRQIEMSQIVGRLERMAESLGITLICTSQVSRQCASEKRKDKRPMISDLCFDTTDVDQILFLHNEHYYNPSEPYKDITECIIAKNNYGTCGTVRLKWDKERFCFYDTEKII